MAKTEKTVNYTPEQTAELRDAYLAAPTAETVNAFAIKLGKTTRSIVAKLSREGIYQKKAYVSKTGEKPEKKEALADKLAALAGLTEAEATSLEKASKTALQKLIDMVS